MAVTLGTWHGEGVGIGAVLQALADLRCTGDRLATRTSVVNLVIVAPSTDRGCEAAGLVHAVGAHPGRTITVIPAEAGGRGVDASVTLHGDRSEGRAIWSEDVVLGVRGPVVDHLDSLVEPLTLPDLPVVVWFTDEVPEVADPLVLGSDAVLVDSRDVGEVGAFPAIASLSRRHPVVDLSWVRLAPWRELLSALFEGADYRPFVTGVRTAEVAGKTGPRHLLAGWLASRLGLSRGAVHLVDGRHAAMRLVAEAGARTARFGVERRAGERVVRASGRVEGGPATDEVLPLPDDSRVWSVTHALTHLERDRSYEQAVQSALVFAS